MQIAALSYIGMSELALVKPDITYEWIENNNHLFLDMLEQLGMNTREPIERQETIQHKNKLNEVVICDRFVGLERTDKAWVESGYASVEAIDKSKSNGILVDLYAMKGMVL